MVNLSELMVTDPEILGGEPVFRGTRVPVASLFEHLESDCSLDEFLENFPSVHRSAAIAVLVGAQELTLERAALVQTALDRAKSSEFARVEIPR
jgi:uncharacterized protein (DUF433 family)